MLALKRPVLAALARALRDDVDAAADDEVRAYAAFRAATEASGPWTTWRGAAPSAGDPDVAALHRYAQYAARAQMAALDERARAAGSTIVFDMPIGTHPLGYDAWRYRDVFAAEANAGAPPDTFFTKGQDWGFHPLHPERVRETRYTYPIACLRHLMAHARVIRLDHVMGIHRLWWIPPGVDARDGAYVRYHAEELYAILTLESARAGVAIVGEDLGTVPREVRRAMSAHGLQRTYVVQEELDPEGARAINPVPRAAMAALNTHDMPPFAMFWRGIDVERRRAMGLFDEAEARAEAERRSLLRRRIVSQLRQDGALTADGEAEVLAALLRWLAASGARLVVANLEDLWGELEPQNVPGTPQGNWSRKGARAIDEPDGLPGRELLAEIDARRRGRG